jgi:hypothetical protein
LYLNFIIVLVGILVLIFLKKCIARPNLKFLNSKINKPPLICIAQEFNLPAPLPILIPFGFFVNGKCGNVLNQTNLLVYSGFFTAFLIKTFNLNICLADIRNGCKVNNPQSP